MNLNASVPAQTIGAAGVPSFDLAARLSRLYDLAQNSDYLFGSPLAFDSERREPFLPRFVYFGPQTSEASPRLAVYAGLGRHDLPAARAVTAFVEKLALNPDIGHALNVSFFPVVNVIGLLAGAEERELSEENWSASAVPELRLLSEDVRMRAYQGIIRVVTSVDPEPSAWLRTIISGFVARSPVEVFTSADFAPWPVRFEALSGELVGRGPLSLAADLPYAPFEVELRLPADWSQALTDAWLSAILKRLITRYRSFLAYGQNL